MTRIRISFTAMELEALAGAAEETLEAVNDGRRWANEGTDTKRALKRATAKILVQCYQLWGREALL